MVKTFFEALKNENPLKIVGCINPFTALLAEKSGLKGLYISGAGVANASYGLPDLALTSLDNVLNDLRKMTAVTELPILVAVSYTHLTLPTKRIV